MITKLIAARRQLDAAIRLLDEEDLAAHTFAYAAYCLLRDKFGPGEMMKMLKKIEEELNLREVPEYLKHAEHYPEAILKEHSPETAHITIALAIRLWREHGRKETEPMRAFSRRKNPYEPKKRHYAATEIIASGDIAEVTKITASSTGGSPTTLGRAAGGDAGDVRSALAAVPSWERRAYPRARRHRIVVQSVRI